MQVHVERVAVVGSQMQEGRPVGQRLAGRGQRQTAGERLGQHARDLCEALALAYPLPPQGRNRGILTLAGRLDHLAVLQTELPDEGIHLPERVVRFDVTPDIAGVEAALDIGDRTHVGRQVPDDGTQHHRRPLPADALQPPESNAPHTKSSESSRPLRLSAVSSNRFRTSPGV